MQFKFVQKCFFIIVNFACKDCKVFVRASCILLKYFNKVPQDLTKFKPGKDEKVYLRQPIFYWTYHLRHCHDSGPITRQSVQNKIKSMLIHFAILMPGTDLFFTSYFPFMYWFYMVLGRSLNFWASSYFHIMTYSNQ